MDTPATRAADILTPTAPRHYAVWRAGDSVRIAMRVTNPEHHNTAVQVLRGWLRGARLTLRELLINGKIQGEQHGD
jgi:hypothetical protein